MTSRCASGCVHASVSGCSDISIDLSWIAAHAASEWLRDTALNSNFSVNLIRAMLCVTD